MAICPPNTAINRILAALGLENVRSLKINAAVNDVVTVVTEQYVTGTQMDDLATALETKEWVLVPKDAGPLTEVERTQLTDAERTCLGYAIRKMDAEYAAGPADVLRGLLERLG
jgi:hypothetical protein